MKLGVQYQGHLQHCPGQYETSYRPEGKRRYATYACIDAGLITENDTCMVIDNNKVKWAQKKLVNELQEKFANDWSENGINCLLFGGRSNDTRVMLDMEGSDKLFPDLIKEEHY